MRALIKAHKPSAIALGLIWLYTACGIAFSVAMPGGLDGADEARNITIVHGAR